MISRVQTFSLSVAQGFFSLFIISIPFHIFFLFYDRVAFQTGIFLPELSGFATLSDIFFLVSIIFFGIYLIVSHRYHTLHLGDKKILTILGLLILTALIIGLFAPYQGLIFKDILRLVQVTVLYIMIQNIPSPTIHWIRLILISGLLQAIIGIFQFLFQRDIGLSALGEPFLALGDTFTETFQWQGNELVQSVGTMQNPHIFAGFMIIAIFAGMLYYSKIHAHKDEDEDYIGRAAPYIFFTLLLALFFTFSRGAWVALIIGGCVLFSYISISWLKKRILLLWIFFTTFAAVFITSIFQTGTLRWYLEIFELGRRTLFENPLGTGTSHFMLLMQENSATALSPSELMPVPNSFAMFMIEGGIVSLILVIVLWFTLFQKFSARKKRGINSVYFSFFVATFILWNLGSGFYSSHALIILFWIMIALLDADIYGEKKLPAHLTEDNFIA